MQMRMIIGIIIIFFSGVFLSGNSVAGDATHVVYQSPDQFVLEAFNGASPHANTLWPNADLRKDLAKALGHKPSLRFKYWGANGKTVWILDEIGKDRPITAGVVINDGQIEDIRVLVFRESRGWEVKHNFFTRQFVNLVLDDRQRLSGKIDNITGATLSVKAMKRMAKAALLMHAHTEERELITALAR